MHILVLADAYSPAEREEAHVTRWFAERAATRSHQVTVFAPRTETAPRRETRDGVEIHRPRAMPGGSPAARFGFLGHFLAALVLVAGLLRWQRGKSIDGVCAHSLPTAVVATMLGRVTGAPVLSVIGAAPSIHDGSPVWGRLVEAVGFRWGLGDAVCCRTTDVAARVERVRPTGVHLLEGGLDARPIRGAADRVDVEAVRAAHDVTADERLLIFAAPLVPRTRPVRAVEVLAALPAHYRLLVVGAGPERSALTDAIADHGLTDRVTVLDARPHARTLELLAAADAVLVTASYSSVGLVALEGLALNRPVFATPVGVLPGIDHPRLHLADHTDLAATIEHELRTYTAPTSGTSPDEALLERYSIERYTDQLLDAIANADTDLTDLTE